MLTFCPSCSNTLILATNPETDQNRYECRTCPFEFHISKTISGRVWMKRKEVEDVMGGKEAWANVDKTEAQCPNEGCDNASAFFYQVQIRSADEPMTTFYKCTHCGQRWKEN